MGESIIRNMQLHRRAEESLKQGLDTAQATWDPDRLKRFLAPAGSIVVEDPRDGSILAMASAPTYRPSDFVGGISTNLFGALQDPANHYPLNNRAIQGLYAPGSTFKPVTALAALEKDVIAPETTINDTGSFKLGQTVFPKLPDSFFTDFTDSGPKATVIICVQAALSGKPCPGTLKVNLPK